MTAVRAVVASALRQAAEHNSATTAAPAAVFWPDPDRVWEPVIGLLQETVPILVLGEHDPDRAQGPAIWIRAALAAPASAELPPHLAAHDDRNPWVIYLPGFARSAFADMSDLEPDIQPLADLSLRSTWWPSAPALPAWTPHSFLGSKNGGRLDLAADAKTRSALTSVLDHLLLEDVDAVRALGRLDAARLQSLVLADEVRALLDWLSDSTALRQKLTAAQWDAFIDTCRSTYGFDPEKDGPITAASRLGARDGAWLEAWTRFADSPRLFAGIPPLLDAASPSAAFSSIGDHPDSWPSWNAAQESALRDALAALGDEPNPHAVRARIAALAEMHSPREDSVWGVLGQAPLAFAADDLAELAHLIESGIPGGDVDAIANWYATDGQRIDDLAMQALAKAPTAADRRAVLTALHALYDPWLDETALAFQSAAASGYRGDTGLAVAPGTCVVFIDALRFDLARRLARRLPAHDVSVSRRFAAFPTVTPSGQPAVAPLSAREIGSGPGFEAGDTQGRPMKGTVFRGALAGAGVQYLKWSDAETGEVSGIAWTQTNTIDSLGHDHGHQLAGMLDQQLDLLSERIAQLLDAGWKQVIVVTDHGFLLPASPATKVTLPLAITDGDAARKPRVARLKPGVAKPAFPVLPWTWDATIDMVSAPGASAFEAGTTYEHGGLSPQECVIPVIHVSAKTGALPTARIAGIRWTGQRCRIDFTPAEAAVLAEVRRSAGDASSVVGGPKQTSEPGEIKILVDEELADAGAPVTVVLLDEEGTVIAQQNTTVGGIE